MNTDNCDLYVKHSYFLKKDKPEEYKDISPEKHLATFSTMEIPIPVVWRLCRNGTMVETSQIA